MRDPSPSSTQVTLNTYLVEIHHGLAAPVVVGGGVANAPLLQQFQVVVHHGPGEKNTVRNTATNKD